MKARIYRPALSVTQSGKAGAGRWLLEFEPAVARSIDPVMGWTSSSDMNSQVRVFFETLDEAKAYAERKGIPYDVKQEKAKRRRFQSYADNFK